MTDQLLNSSRSAAAAPTLDTLGLDFPLLTHLCWTRFMCLLICYQCKQQNTMSTLVAVWWSIFRPEEQWVALLSLLSASWKQDRSAFGTLKPTVRHLWKRSYAKLFLQTDFWWLIIGVYLVSAMLLQFLVELQGDADHHFGLVPVGVGDVVQDAIEIWSSGREKTFMSKDEKLAIFCYLMFDSYWQSCTNIDQ